MARNSELMKKVDIFIGKKIWDERLSRGRSRSQLASQIGVTHQQLKKYEEGNNRMSPGRLVLTAQALNKSMGWFFEGFSELAEPVAESTHRRMCIEVSRNFMKMKNSNHQYLVNDLVKGLADAG